MKPTIDGVIEINVDRLVESRAVVMANSGGGKSWALRRILEQTNGAVQQIVIDPEDEFYTLREKSDYVLAGRQGGDCPADVRSAAMLARRLLELGVSAVVGIYELKAHERVQFVRYFLESLVNAPKDLWHPVLVVIDEAHIFAPEGRQCESTQAVIDLMTRGRKRGFCGLLATQRPAMLAKDASAQANNKMIGRFSQDIDVKRAAEDMGFYRREDQASLRTLKPGEFFVTGPALCDDVQQVKVGAVQTTHPRAGQRATPAPPPKDRVKAVLAKLADLPAEAAAEAKTVAELQKEVRTLKAAVAVVAPVDPAAIDKARAEGARDAERRYAKLAAQTQTTATRIQRAMASFVETCTAELSKLAEIIPENIPQVPTALPSARPAPVARPMPAISQARAATGNGDSAVGNGGLRKILTVLAQRNGLSATQVGVRAGLSSTGGAFGNMLSKGRTEGWLEGGRDRLQITQAGIDAIGPFDPLPEGQELIAYWLRELGDSMPSKILAVLAEAYPSSMSKEQIGAATCLSHTGGSFGNALSRLRTLELIEGKGELSASAEFFQ